MHKTPALSIYHNVLNEAIATQERHKDEVENTIYLNPGKQQTIATSKHLGSNTGKPNIILPHTAEPEILRLII